MESILINPQSKKELNFLKTLLANLNVKSTVLNEEEQEDLGLSVLMREVDKTDLVSRDQIFRKLQSK